MDQPLTSNLAELAAVDRMQSFLSGEKSLNRVKPRRIAAMDRHSLIPMRRLAAQNLSRLIDRIWSPKPT